MAKHLTSSMHLTLWCVTAVLAVVVLTLAIVLLHSLVRDASIPAGVVFFLLLSVAVLAGIVAQWRRYWFLPADLVRLLSTHGGTDVQQRSSTRGTQIRARLGPLWLLGTLNRPILDVLPTWPTYELSRKLTMSMSEFMLQGANVEVVQLGEFSKLPEIDIDSNSRRGVSPVGTGNESLDRAIQRARQSLGDVDVSLQVQIRPDRIEVGVDGGAWLGSGFTQKIESCLQLAQTLIGELAGSFTPMDPKEWTVEREYIHVRRDSPVASVERRRRIVHA